MSRGDFLLAKKEGAMLKVQADQTEGMLRFICINYKTINWRITKTSTVTESFSSINKSSIKKQNKKLSILSSSPIKPADEHLVREAHASPELEAAVGDLSHQTARLELTHGSQHSDVITGHVLTCEKKYK